MKSAKEILDEMWNTSPMGFFYVSQELWERLVADTRLVRKGGHPLMIGMKVAVKAELSGPESWEWLPRVQ